jgi:hypothetical protein
MEMVVEGSKPPLEENGAISGAFMMAKIPAN